MISTKTIAKLGFRLLRHSQGARYSTIPSSYFENVKAEDIEKFEFFLAEDNMLVLVPIFKKSDQENLQVMEAPSQPANETTEGTN